MRWRNGRQDSRFVAIKFGGRAKRPNRRQREPVHPPPVRRLQAAF